MRASQYGRRKTPSCLSSNASLQLSPDIVLPEALSWAAISPPPSSPTPMPSRKRLYSSISISSSPIKPPHHENTNVKQSDVEGITFHKRQKTLSDYFSSSTVSPSNPVPSDKNKKKIASTFVKKEQMYLDLGQGGFGPTQCHECCMSYSRGVAEDESTHRQYHKIYLRGIIAPKAIVSSLFILATMNMMNGIAVEFVRIGMDKSCSKLRSRMEKVLLQMQQELGAVALESSFFGVGQRETVIAIDCTSRKIIGCILTEPLKHAFRVDTTCNEKNVDENRPVLDVSPSQFCPVHVDAMVGIARIWVSRQYRRIGVAKRLLHCAVSLYGKEIERDQVAFSAPTNDGALLARKWSGRLDFKVYV